MIKFTNSNVGKMQDEMLAVLNKYGFKNVNFTGNTRSYGVHETTFKIVANIGGTTSNADQDLADACHIHGIDVKVKGQKGETLIEYHSRKRLYPFIYTSISGKRYKCDADAWKRKL